MSDPNGTEIDVEKEKEFFIKDIPVTMDDWAIFHIFRRFGIVHSVRIPVQAQSPQKFGFVVMADLNGSDNVRKELVKKRLKIDENVSFLVNDIRVPASGSNPLTKSQNLPRVMQPINYQQGTNGQRRRSAEAIQNYQAPIDLNCRSQYLPLNKPTSVKVVKSPFPAKEDEGFTFHVIPIDADTTLPIQQAMNTYCHKTPNMSAKSFDLKVGQFVLFGRNATAYRAQRISEEHLYLVDSGEIVPFNPAMLFPIVSDFCKQNTLVATCSLYGVEWKDTRVDLFTRYREILFVWCEKEGHLNVTARAYEGALSLVDVSGNNDVNFSKSIASKGSCVVVAPQLVVYSKIEMMALRDQMTELPSELSKNDFKSIIQPMKSMEIV